MLIAVDKEKCIDLGDGFYLSPANRADYWRVCFIQGVVCQCLSDELPMNEQGIEDFRKAIMPVFKWGVDVGKQMKTTEIKGVVREVFL